MWTAIIARVRGVIATSTASGSMLWVDGCIDKYGHCSNEGYGTGRGYKRIGWHDNLVAQADAGSL